MAQLRSATTPPVFESYCNFRGDSTQTTLAVGIAFQLRFRQVEFAGPFVHDAYLRLLSDDGVMQLPLGDDFLREVADRVVVALPGVTAVRLQADDPFDRIRFTWTGAIPVLPRPAQ